MRLEIPAGIAGTAALHLERKRHRPEIVISHMFSDRLKADGQNEAPVLGLRPIGWTEVGLK